MLPQQNHANLVFTFLWNSCRVAGLNGHHWCCYFCSILELVAWHLHLVKFTGSDKIRSANLSKNIELFVTRLDRKKWLKWFCFWCHEAPRVHEIRNGFDTNIVCEKINAKSDSYHSYHVTVTLSAHASLFKEAVSVLMSIQIYGCAR